MFGRRKQQIPAAPPGPAPEARPGAKGRPTPRRSHAQAANRRPLVPSDRKAAAAASREKARIARRKMQEAMLTGDDRYLPARDRGPVRRYVRDVIDARRSVGELFLPVALVSLVLGYNRLTALVAYLALYVMVLAVLVDSLLLRRSLRRRLTDRYGQVDKGLFTYALLRSLQLRRLRRPYPQVKRGDRID